MRKAHSRSIFMGALAIASAGIAGQAYGSTGYEFPENGTEQVGRGGAWVARASNPLATYFNPAGLAGQPSSIILNTSLIWQKNCYTPKNADGSAVEYDRWLYSEPVCNTDSGTPFPNPQLAATIRITDKLGIGIGALGPSTRGKFDYPLTAPGDREGFGAGEGPSPTRYLLVADDLLVVWPQIGIGYEIAPNLRVGASFIWGLAHLKFTSIAQGMVDATLPGRFDQDVQADLSVTDLFVPGFTAGVLYSPSSKIDLAAWYHWSDDIKAKGDAVVRGVVYDPRGVLKDPSAQSETTLDDVVDLTAPWPMQARIGIRYHEPRTGGLEPGAEQRTGIDPLSQDQFDIELNLTWANNSAFDKLGITFPRGTEVTVDSINMNLPPDSSIEHRWKDAIGIRLGGDYAIIQNRLAVRAGGFFETEAQDPKYLHVDYVPSQLYGFGLGGTVRFGPADVMVGYEHVFFDGLDNEGEGATTGLAGTPPYRTPLAVNNGSNSSSVNIASVGASYTF